MLFGDKLKSIRKEKNLSQDEMGDLLFMSQSNYCKYETGKKKPSIDLLLLVSRQFNIPIHELLPDDYKNSEVGNSILNAGNHYSLPKELLDTFLRQFEVTNYFMKDIVKRLQVLEKRK